MRIQLVSTFLFLLSVSGAFAVSDTLRAVELNEIVIKAGNHTQSNGKQSYNRAIKRIVADSVSHTNLSYGSLSEYIAQETPIFIKEAGNGMLASISLRGTASSHTAVMWNGLPVGSLTMGQTDFNQLPLFVFDDVALHLGGESALFGSGAIGGSVLLGSKTEFERRIALEMQQTVGEFGYTFSGIKFRGGNERLQSKTVVLYNYCKNNFPIIRKEFEGTYIEKQRNATFYNYSIVQELFSKISLRDQLSAHFWHSYYFREIQPSIQNNKNQALYNEISDRNSRLIVAYKHAGAIHLDVNLSYVNDYQLYFEDIIACQTFRAMSDAEYKWRKLGLKAGFDARYILPQVYSYHADVDEVRADIYLLTHYAPWNNVDINLNIRQGFVSEIRVPITPSLGATWLFLQKTKHKMRIRGNLARSFKVPTLNERYWGEGNNTYLLPEDGFNKELSIDYAFAKSDYFLHFDVTAYSNLVSNWIMWMPRGDIWKPLNVAKVEAKGMEISMKQTCMIAKHDFLLRCSYSYSNTKVIAGFSDMSSFTGRQMPLLPKHTINSAFNYQFSKRYFFHLNFNYTDARASSNMFDLMNAYFLLNATVGYNFKFGNHLLNTSFHLNNMLNSNYQTMPNKAMPLRNFLFTIKYQFNKLKL